jgi:hypothetical protein
MRGNPVWGVFRIARRPFASTRAAFVAESPRTARQRFLETALTARGRVVGLEQEVSILHNGEHLSFGYPIVRFVTAQGEEVEFRSEKGFTPCRARVGDDVTVYYDPKDPGDACLENAQLL